MGPLERQGTTIADDMLKRELMRRELARRSPENPQAKPISPKMAHLLGGAADAASTFTFLKRGTGQEANPMFAFTKNKPVATGAAVMGSTLASNLLARALGKKFPKLADALMANQGAQQMMLAANNFSLDGKPGHQDSFTKYGETMKTNAMTQAKRLHGR